MKKVGTTCIALTLLCAPVSGPWAEEPDMAALSDNSRAAIRTFAGRLKGELQAAMKAGGPTEAVEVCSSRASVIAAQVSSELGLRLGRTSLRYRNPSNAPDDWERGILQNFAARHSDGIDAGNLEWAEIADVDGQPRFRFMKAIPTEALCLTCHGSELDPALDARLSEIYPDDLARGYAEGDLRGAFTVISDL
jgi:hypothetical protein